MAEPNGLYYMRARYYDPQVRRFISEDQIGFEGGDLNLYAYVQNNPINKVDPLGLWNVNFNYTGGPGWGVQLESKSAKTDFMLMLAVAPALDQAPR